ncbi:MAG: hypothetical protein M3322_01080 [Actinomycetota bacterium]|nr:hypothetical protein [Actinomycetota bacterium]
MSRQGSELRLRSALRDEVWEPRRELIARCAGCGEAAPGKGCSCGIHAVRAPAAAAPYLVGRNEADDLHRVIGEVALWGWVVAGESGWRASRAYPARIVVPAGHPGGRETVVDEIAAALAVYAVPVTVA